MLADETGEMKIIGSSLLIAVMSAVFMPYEFVAIAVS
jgi:hypothetical protein